MLHYKHARKPPGESPTALASVETWPGAANPKHHNSKGFLALPPRYRRSHGDATAENPPKKARSSPEPSPCARWFGVQWWTCRPRSHEARRVSLPKAREPLPCRAFGQGRTAFQSGKLRLEFGVFYDGVAILESPGDQLASQFRIRTSQSVYRARIRQLIQDNCDRDASSRLVCVFVLPQRRRDADEELGQDQPAFALRATSRQAGSTG